MRLRSLAFTFPASLALAVPLLGCTEDTEEPAPGAARVRVVHASPDAPAVDIYAAGVAAPLFSDLSYGEASAYIEVPEGAYTLEVRPAGQPDAVPAYTVDVTMLPEQQYTAIAAGFLASTDDGDRFRVMALQEGFTAPAADQVAVRIVHAAADAPTVGIDVGADDPARPEIAGLGRFGETGASGVALPAGQSLRIGIAAAGTNVTTFTTPPLPGGSELFAVAIGRLGDHPRLATGFSVMAIGEGGALGTIAQDPMVYALHASPDAPAVDIREANSDALLIGGLGYGAIKGVQVPPGNYTLDFYGAGSPAGTPAVSMPVNGLAAGQRYLAVATGFLSPAAGEPGFRLIATADELAIDPTRARIGAIHASPDAPAVDIATASGNTMAQPALIEDFDFGEIAGGEGLAVPPATLRLGIGAANAPSAVATFNVTTSAGMRAFAVATGALSPAAGEQPFRLTIVDTSRSPWSASAIAPN
jgi:hypothetical protein